MAICRLICHEIATHRLTLINAGGGGHNHLRPKENRVFPQQNIEGTRDQSVNSSLPVMVQKKKNRVLYLSWFNRGGII